MAGALTLAIGIAIQNFPEGAIISCLFAVRGTNGADPSHWACCPSGGTGGAILAIALASIVTPILPYMLAFAAGAMIYVVVEELIPEASEGEHSNLGTIAFAIGFALMMDVDARIACMGEHLRKNSENSRKDVRICPWKMKKKYNS